MLVFVSSLFLLKTDCTNNSGAQGDGSTQGTCSSDLVCNADGTCTTCAITASVPHGGCSAASPTCVSGTTCQVSDYSFSRYQYTKDSIYSV